ncbi:hypothetical protein V5738_02645 [Salinisphaera sp. SPP-AMP-43]|uniref:hypothetical protein n=1 Tax=Salinisphaera sp. SPP-AMP-43 TaxID=3121288 RepID=UPI003C6DBCD7
MFLVVFNQQGKNYVCSSVLLPVCLVSEDDCAGMAAAYEHTRASRLCRQARIGSVVVVLLIAYILPFEQILACFSNIVLAVTSLIAFFAVLGYVLDRGQIFAAMPYRKCMRLPISGLPAGRPRVTLYTVLMALCAVLIWRGVADLVGGGALRGDALSYWLLMLTFVPLGLEASARAVLAVFYRF